MLHPFIYMYLYIYKIFIYINIYIYNIFIIYNIYIGVIQKVRSLRTGVQGASLKSEQTHTAAGGS